MIRMDNGTLNGIHCSFVVRFMTPIGLFDSLELAVDAVRSLDLDPLLCVKAVAVAETPETYEVCP